MFSAARTGNIETCRKPEIVADAAYRILTAKSDTLTGQTLIDEDFLRQHGITDFDPYACDPDFAGKLLPDIFLDG